MLLVKHIAHAGPTTLRLGVALLSFFFNFSSIQRGKPGQHTSENRHPQKRPCVHAHKLQNLPNGGIASTLSSL